MPVQACVRFLTIKHEESERKTKQLTDHPVASPKTISVQSILESHACCWRLLLILGFHRLWDRESGTTLKVKRQTLDGTWWTLETAYGWCLSVSRLQAQGNNALDVRFMIPQMIASWHQTGRSTVCQQSNEPSWSLDASGLNLFLLASCSSSFPWRWSSSWLPDVYFLSFPTCNSSRMQRIVIPGEPTDFELFSIFCHEPVQSLQ